MPVRQGEQAVEVGTPLGRGPHGEPDVVGQERHRQPSADGVGHPLGLLTFDEDALAPTL